MSSPLGWGWPVFAAAAAGLAAATASSSPWVATGAAAVAVTAAGITLARVLGRAAAAPVRELAPALPPASGVRAMFTAGTIGREDLVLTLDWLERKWSRPGLKTRTAEELAPLLAAPPEKFRAYLEQRLVQIEGSL